MKQHVKELSKNLSQEQRKLFTAFMQMDEAQQKIVLAFVQGLTGSKRYKAHQSK